MIAVRLGELEKLAASAILWPVTAEWGAVTPAMRRFEIAAGAGVDEQCRRMGDLPVGSAIVTAAGDLPAELLIHAVVRSATEPVSETGVAKALLNALRRADEWGIEELALPPLGTGAGNLDAEVAAEVMVPILVEWLRSDRHPHRVIVVVETEYELDVFERGARQAEAAGTGDAAGLPTLDP